MVLLVIDTQKLITNETLYDFHLFVCNVKRLVTEARRNEIEVIYIRHDDGIDKELTKGKDGYEIYEGWKPADGEQVFDKNVNSAFKESGLLDYLRNKRENTIIIVGLQTDYCIDANVKCGFEHGFHVIVPEKANTTVDNHFMSAQESYEYYNKFIWNGRYAECLSVDQTIELMNNRKNNKEI